MPRVVRILVTLFLVAVFGILAFLSWNGWMSDHGNSNRIIAMMSDLQRWLVQTLGGKPTAGIFALAAVTMLLVGFLPEKKES